MSIRVIEGQRNTSILAPNFGLRDLSPPSVTTFLLFLDTFTGTGELADHTPDIDSVGGGWQQDFGNGNMEILSNEATIPGSVGNRSAGYTVQTNKSDVVITCAIRKLSFRLTSSMLLRFLDMNNYWFSGINTANGAFFINEFNLGSTIVRDVVFNSEFSGGATGNTYNLTLTASGQSITAKSVSNGGTFNISFLLASFLQTQTRHGIRGVSVPSGSDCFYDNLKMVG